MGIRLGIAVGALFILSLNIYVSSYKWKILLSAQGILLSLRKLSNCYWISTFFGNYLPTNFGGDVVRLMMLDELGRSAQVAASIVLERITGFIILISWTVFSLIMRPNYFKAGHLLPVIWIVVGLGIFAILILFWFGDKLTALRGILFKNKSTGVFKIFIKIQKMMDAIAHYRGKRKEILLSFIFSILFYIIILIFNYLVLISVGSDLSLREVFFVTPVIPLVSMLPLSLNGIGISEGAYVIFYSQAGLQPSEAFAAAVVRRFIHLAVSLVGGFLWMGKPSKTFNLKSIGN